jgi:pimeloyl-ACP methyl ester carboxylesterase
MSSPTVSASSDGAAVRKDGRTGITEQAELFGGADLKVFGCRSLPDGVPVDGVVICPTLLAESIRNYRREVLLARELAARGFAVQRFHYQGSGNSDGNGADVTIETMLSNALAARERLIAMTGSVRVAFMGTRWGALIAGMAAARCQRAPLILWEPVVDPAGYFREAFRSQLVYDLKKRSSASPSTDALVRELHRSGSVDILGWSLHEALYESAIGRSLELELGDAPRAILLMQIGRRVALRNEYALLVDRWRQRGFSVQTHMVQEQPDWWFSGEYWVPDETRESTKTLTRATVNWMIQMSRAERG